MHSFVNQSSTAAKKDNWQQLQRFFKKKGFVIEDDLIESTLQAHHNAATVLMENLYMFFTDRTLPEFPAVQDEGEEEAATGRVGTVRGTPGRPATRAPREATPAGNKAGTPTVAGSAGSAPIQRDFPETPVLIFSSAKVRNVENPAQEVHKLRTPVP